ncbi:MAG: zf-HC2 domain-containing protein [Rubrobacteraceae bacterium]
MSLPGGCGCEPEEIFELADQALTPERERAVRSHLEQCPGCYELYKRETDLNSCLESLSFSEPRSVCAGVAMALPTRPLKARLLWTLLAVMLLSTALFALGVNGVNPAAFVVDAMTMFWGSAAMITDVLDTVLAIAGGTLLTVLAVGALIDLLLAAIFVSVFRRRTRQV